MNRSVRYTGKTHSFPGGMALSAAVSMGITLILGAVIACGMNREIITWDQAGYWIMGLLFLGAFAGGKAAYGAMKRQRLVVSALSGLTYWALLLCMTALFFGGDYEAVWVTAAIIFAGSGVSALISRPEPRKRSAKKGRGNR